MINKKNFVFRDAIEQIKTDRKNERSNSRLKRLGSIRSRDALSEEARDSKMNENDEILSNPDMNPFALIDKFTAKKKIKLFAKKLKKRPSDPIRLDLEEQPVVTNFTKFNSRCLSNLK